MHIYSKNGSERFDQVGWLDYAYGEDSVTSGIAENTNIDLLINGILDPISFFIEDCVVEACKLNSHLKMRQFYLINKEQTKAVGNFIFILRIEFME